MQYYFSEMEYLDRLKLTVKRIGLGENVNMAFHSHDFSEIVVVYKTDGKALHWCEGNSCQLHRGDVLVIHPGVSHAYENTEGLELINIIYDTSLLPVPKLDGENLKLFQVLTDCNWMKDDPKTPVVTLNDSQLRHINGHIKDMENEIAREQPGCRLCVFGLFLAMLIYIARVGGVMEYDLSESPAAQAVCYLNTHYLEPVTVEFLAKMCNMSRSGFFASFRAITGYTPMEYQREKRLKLAESLIQSTDKTLGEIAGDCGFYDSNHLSRLFSHRYGISPGKMRRKK